MTWIGLPVDFADQCGDLGRRIGLRAAERQRRLAGEVARQCRGGTMRKIVTCDLGNLAIAGGAIPVTGSKHRRQARKQVFVVPIVAQHGPARQPAGCNGCFGAGMIRRKQDRRTFGLGHRGIDEVLDAGLGGSFDSGLVLCEPASWAIDRVGADQQQPLCTLKRGRQRCRVFEIAGAHCHALRCPGRKLIGRAAGRDDVAWPELSVCSGDGAGRAVRSDPKRR